jgi:hypothetical protein
MVGDQVSVGMTFTSFQALLGAVVMGKYLHVEFKYHEPIARP